MSEVEQWAKDYFGSPEWYRELNHFKNIYVGQKLLWMPDGLEHPTNPCLVVVRKIRQRYLGDVDNKTLEDEIWIGTKTLLAKEQYEDAYPNPVKRFNSYLCWNEYERILEACKMIFIRDITPSDIIGQIKAEDLTDADVKRVEQMIQNMDKRDERSFEGALKELQKDMGYEIRRRRELAGWTKETFAARCGLNRGYLSDVEAGKVPIKLDKLLRISNSLNVNPSLLLEGKTDEAA